MRAPLYGSAVLLALCAGGMVRAQEVSMPAPAMVPMAPAGDLPVATAAPAAAVSLSPTGLAVQPVGWRRYGYRPYGAYYRPYGAYYRPYTYNYGYAPNYAYGPGYGYAAPYYYGSYYRGSYGPRWGYGRRGWYY